LISTSTVVGLSADSAGTLNPLAVSTSPADNLRRPPELKTEEPGAIRIGFSVAPGLVISAG
jgi:hypothetical protein